jgi:Bacterial Ig-like domain (group 3)/FG-GAP repeat
MMNARIVAATIPIFCLAISPTVAGASCLPASIQRDASSRSVGGANELTASDGAAQDAFGFSVALSGDGSVALVAAPSHSVGGTFEAGAVYVFRRGGSGYTQTGELTASDGATDEFFGFSVALSANGRALVGAYDYEAATGAAYVFSRTGSTYRQTAELTASDGAPYEAFGLSVALGADGSSAVVGSPFHATGNPVPGNGAAYVFRRSGSHYTQTAELTASDGAIGDQFGTSVALSSTGSTALVGAFLHPVHRDVRSGAAYVFSRSGSTYKQTAELTASDGAGGSQFGASVALSANGSTALVGAYRHAVNDYSDAGAAYVFTKSSATITSVSLTSGANPSHYGDPLTFTANVFPASGPTGSVTFWDGMPGSSGGVEFGSSTVSSGQASVTTSQLQVGVHHVYAVYSGGSKFVGSEGEADQTVVLAHARILYVGAWIVTRGKKATLSAYLFVTTGRPVVGRKMVITLGTGGTAQQCTTHVTNSHGYAACTIPHIKQPRGNALVTVRFGGDPRGPHYDYAPAKGSTVITVKK